MQISRCKGGNLNHQLRDCRAAGRQACGCHAILHPASCRRERSGAHAKKRESLLMDAINLLAAHEPLPQRYFDHALSGEWKDFRDCRLRPDLVVIDRKPIMTPTPKA